MTKSTILVKICLFFIVLHGIQISIALGSSTMRTYYNSQRLESIFSTWDNTDRTERIQLFTHYYSEQTELEAFQSPHAVDFVDQHILRQEDDGIERRMIDEALDIADQRDKERKIWSGV
ncbi:hypothetical protein DL98DRAFT_528856 [Cadophora sp. DSE1049]|nr:hypothetical protein DL98DRAFT_528856 [Cadophora sp. DSE1049]